MAMQNPYFRYWVLWLFLLGVLVIVFLQVISGYNIKRLISGNRKLLGEVELQKNLRGLESDVVILESDVRGGVITGDTIKLNQAATQTVSLNQTLDHLDTSEFSGSARNDLNDLVQLIRAKNQYNQQIIDVFNSRGREAAESYISSHRGQHLRDSILQIIASLDAFR